MVVLNLLSGVPSGKMTQPVYPQLDCLFNAVYIFLSIIVLRIQFSATNFTGSESSGEVIVAIVMSGGVADRNIIIQFSLNEETATGQTHRLNNDDYYYYYKQ